MRTKRRRLKRKTPFIICCLLLLALAAGGFMLVKGFFFPPVPGGDSELGLSPDEVVRGERLNVLLLGIDARRGETMARTDTMILASVDPKSKQVILLSIPRDTGVNIPGHGWDKINTAAVYGGPELSMKVVSNLLGVPVKYYVLTNFSGFKDIVDALGGVTLNVERDMYHEDPTDGGIYRINLKKGLQRLDGDKALQYVRYRNYDMGDIERTKNQQKFLSALAREMLQPATIPKLPKLVPVISRYVDTNLGLGDMYTLASASGNLEGGNIVTQTLPGRPIIVNGISYWGVSPVEARQVVAKLFKGETVTEIVMTTPMDSRYLPKGAVIGPQDESRAEGVETNVASRQEEGENGAAVQPELPVKQDRQSQAGSEDSGSGVTGGSGATVIITPVNGDAGAGREIGSENASDENVSGGVVPETGDVTGDEGAEGLDAGTGTEEDGAEGGAASGA